MDQRHVLFVAQIAEAALAGERDRAESYLKQLVERLDSEGQIEAARRLEKVLNVRGAKKASLARASKVNETRVPVDSETAFGIADRDEILQGSVDVVLSNENDAMIRQFVSYVHASERLKAGGVSISPTLLIYGPPGTGKTQCAKYVASELRLPLVTARTDALISSYLGSTSKNVRRLFEYAHAEPCVLFLDELDAIAKMRDDSRELGELKRVVISLLQNIDKLDSEHVLIAATNHEHLLDRAIWRRFAYKLKMDMPDLDARKELLRTFFGRFIEADVVDYIAPLGENLSGAQLKLAVDEAIRAAVMDGATTVSGEIACEKLLREHGKHFSNRSEMIRFLRGDNPRLYSQPALARLFDVSQPYISKVLKKDGTNGRRRPASD